MLFLTRKGVQVGRYRTAGEVQEALDAVVARNAERVAGGCDAHRVPTPLDELIRGEVERGVDVDGGGGGAEVCVERQEVFRALLGYFFADGVHPLDVVRRVYAVAKAVAPDLIGDMSLEDLAVLCGDGGRATVSARIKRVYNRYIEESGGRGVQAHFQKSATTVRRYAEAQKGNRNRRKGKRKF